jgi:L-serine dehydratase
MPESPPGLLDVFGPIMIGPSSSHTAGVARIAYLARKIFAHPLARARVIFYGSLARTYRGHGSDAAAIAGLLGMLPDDERLGSAPALAVEAGLPVEIVVVFDGPVRYHPNTVVIEQWSEEHTLRVRGASVGGGEILLQSVAGYETNLDGSLHALLVLHHDEPGVIARVATVLAGRGINIASLSSHRKDKGDEALIVAEVDAAVPTEVCDSLRAVPAVREVVSIPAIMA